MDYRAIEGLVCTATINKWKHEKSTGRQVADKDTWVGGNGTRSASINYNIP